MPEKVHPEWSSFAGDSVEGLVYSTGRVSKPRLVFHALRIDLFNPVLRIVAGGAGNGGSLSAKVSTFVRDNDLLAGINALPFDTVSGREGERRTNVGIVIANSEILSPPHPDFDALVFYTDRSAAIIAQATLYSGSDIDHAVGGFRRILQDSEPVPRVFGLDARHPRSAAGLSPDGRFLYLLVIDGRRLRSIGATEMETALLLHALGAGEGINLDGGGSSTLALRYPNGKVRVVNTPIHSGIPGRERAVAGSLGVGISE